MAEVAVEGVIKIRNWSRFQHYKSRTPPWIKLHRSILHNREWAALSGDASKLLVECWLIASESEDGTIAGSTADLAWRLHREDVLQVARLLQELVERKFIELCKHDASELLARRGQDATPETERETEGETEQKTDPIAKAIGASAVVDNPQNSGEQQQAADPELEGILPWGMPLLRSLGFNCDSHDGSILKAIDGKVERDSLEQAVRGLALMRNAGELVKTMGVEKDGKLSMKMLYALGAKAGARHLFGEAKDRWIRHEETLARKQRLPMKSVSQTLKLMSQ